MKTTSALRAIKQGILICDKDSCIYYFNKAYEDYIGVSLKAAQGRKLIEFRGGAKAPEVIETGQPIEHLYRQERGQEYLASIYPIREKDEVIGSISIVTSIEEPEKFMDAMPGKHTGSLAERVREFEKKEIQYMMSVYGDSTESKRRIAKELNISLATLYNKLMD